MKKRIPKAKTTGHRAGTKRRDMRWIDAQGETWASKFECLVYESGKRASLKIRKCDKGGSDTVAYSSKVQNGRCASCQGTDVGQERTYTSDLYLLSRRPQEEPSLGEGGYYIETKGYTRAPQRSLLRSICASGAIPNLRFILQANYKAIGSLTFGDWITKYLKKPWVVWKGEWPKESEWVYPIERSIKKVAN